MVLLILVISIVASTTTTMMMMVMMFVAATRNARLDTALGLSHWARFSPDGTGYLLKKATAYGYPREIPIGVWIMPKTD
jgi:hypothetical protein